MADETTKTVTQQVQELIEEIQIGRAHV